MHSKEQIHSAIESAHRSFLSYRHTKPSQKISFLKRIGERIDAERQSLITIASKETNLPHDRLGGEVTRTINQLYQFANLLQEGSWVRAIFDKADPDRKPLAKPDLRQMQQPIGVVAVFGASNFPFAYSVCGGDTAAALAAGCPVVYKVNPGHPETSGAVTKIVIDAARETGMPEGVFAMIEGTSNETGIALVTHPLIKAVGFTGSFKGGRAIYDACAAREEPIPVYAEMGSTNPVFILPEIMEQRGEEIARMLAASNTMSAGQFCTNPGIMIANGSAAVKKYYDAFADQITKTPSAPMLTKNIFAGFEERMQSVQQKKQVDVRAVADGNEGGNARAHMFIASAKNFLGDHELWEEMFGPSSVQVTADSTDDMIKIADALPGQLTATVWGTDKELKDNIELIRILELKAGRLIINGVPTGVEVSPAMNHGGPYPATTDSKFTSVGTQSIYRFTRPICYQNFPEFLLPDELRTFSQ